VPADVTMEWLEVCLVGLDGEGAEVAWEVLSRYAHGSPVIEEVRGADTPEQAQPARLVAKAYLPDTPEGHQALQRLREALWHLSQLYPLPEPEVRRLATADWSEAWKQHYAPIRVGQRLLVVPAWDETAEAGGRVVVRLDPGMAFGTGQHPSTQLCLRLLEAVLRPGDRVLDVGCGSGILAIAAAKLGAGEVWAVDIDEVAVRATCENAALNALPCRREGPVKGGIYVQHGSVDVAAGPFDLILMNILAEVIVSLMPETAPRLAPGGRLILGGILAPREEVVCDALAAHRLRLLKREQAGDWISLLAVRENQIEPSE